MSYAKFLLKERPFNGFVISGAHPIERPYQNAFEAHSTVSFLCSPVTSEPFNESFSNKATESKTVEL